MTIIMGLDPGLKGGVAFYNKDTHDLHVYAMPIETRKNGKTYIQGTELARLVKIHGPAEAWVEDVYSSPQMGVTSAFTFGEGKGVLTGVLDALGVPIRLVSPAAWKKRMRLSADKGQAKKLARAMFPKIKISTEGKCEATPIAVYGSLQGLSLTHPRMKVLR